MLTCVAIGKTPFDWWIPDPKSEDNKYIPSRFCSKKCEILRSVETEATKKNTKIRNNPNHFRKGFRFPQSGVNGMDFLWSHIPSLLESSCWFVRWMAEIVCHCGTLIGQSIPFWHGKMRFSPWRWLGGIEKKELAPLKIKNNLLKNDAWKFSF